jgi:uncharacterized protein YciI
MLYAVWALDRDGALAERLRVREAHRARLRAPAPHAVEVKLAGPLLAAAEAHTMCGTLLVVEAASAQAVRAFVEDDPYVHAGVYGSLQILPWRCGLGPLAPTESSSTATP